MRTSPVRFMAAGLTVMLMAGAARSQPSFMHGDPSLLVRKNLGGAINTARAEITPVLSPDGHTLYFDRKFDTRNVNGGNDPDDIYISTRGADGTWSHAVNIGPPLNTPGSDVLFWISPDGRTALVHNGREVDGHPVGLAIAHMGPDGVWLPPQPISIQGVDGIEENGEGFAAFIAPDGRHLLLAAALDTTHPENVDLYVCNALSTDYLQWGRPASLGDTVNTALYEWAPQMAGDDMTLYYSSGGLLGYGAADIYMTRRLDDTWRHWSEPANLGQTINSMEYEAALSLAPDGIHAYVSAATHDDQGYGKTDIFEITLPDTLRPRVIATIAGSLRARGRATQGLVRLEDVSGRELGSSTTDSSGRFEFRVIAGTGYRITGWADGYAETAMNVKAPAGSAREIPVRVNLTTAGSGAPSSWGTSSTPPSHRKPLSGGGLTNEPPVVQKVLVEIGGFTANSATIPADALARLGKAVTDIKTLYAGTLLGIDVIGMIPRGGEHEDPVIAQHRADAVRSWLLANGLPQTPIVASTRDATEATVSAHADSRRVVVKIIAMR